MKSKPTRAKNPPLATGQLWQIQDGYVQITHVGKTLTEYKLLQKPGQRAVRARMDSVISVEAYLKTNKARLMPNPAEPLKPAA